MTYRNCKLFLGIFYGSILFLFCSDFDLMKEKNLKTDEFYSLRFATLTSKKETDTTEPIPLDNGKITVSKVLYSQAEFNWGKSEDATTKQESLNYSLYYSTENNLATKEDVKKNGKLLTSDTNITSYQFKNLSSLTTYYVNVIVKDESGNESVYVNSSFKTSDNKNFLFAGSRSKGNLGGRSGSDQICSNTYNSSFESYYQCNNIHAFLSIDSNDEIRDFPTNYSMPIDLSFYGISGANYSEKYLIDNFTNLLSITTGSSYALNSSLMDADLFASGVPYRYWTGSNYDGSVLDDNCVNFTSSESSESGFIGIGTDVDEDWIATGSYYCDNSFYVICVCY